MITPAKAAAAARRQLLAMARPAGAFDASRYFRSTEGLGFCNIRSATVRQTARALADATREQWTLDDAVAFADRMMRDRHLEVKAFGLELLARRRRELGPALLPVCRRWLSTNLSANWATTDLMCGRVLGPMLVSHQALLRRTLPLWARHRNLWVRRASAVALLPSIREGLSLDVAYAIAARLHADDEDLIQKAVGWLLRELGKIDAARLEAYLRKNGPRIPRTTVRYAIERFSPARRRRLLEITRIPG